MLKLQHGALGVFDLSGLHNFVRIESMTILNDHYRTAERITLISLLVNILLTLVKWGAGVLGHSFALVADAIESTNDIFASILVLVGFKYSQKPPDENHPYGHGKAEILVTFLAVGFLVASATLIAYESISNIRHPHPVPKPFTLWVLAGVVIIKAVFSKIVFDKSAHTGSTVLKAEAWHHKSDALTSLAAFIGISIALWLGPEYAAADDWAALVAAGFILYNSYLIFRPALGEMMDEHNYDDLILRIRNVSKKVEGVIDTEKCLVRKAGMSYFVDLHAEVDPQLSVMEGHRISHCLKDAIQAEIPEIQDVLIHIEPHHLYKFATQK